VLRSRVQQASDPGEAVLGRGSPGGASARPARERHHIAVGAERGEHLRDGRLRDVPEFFELGLGVRRVPVAARRLLEILKPGLVTPALKGGHVARGRARQHNIDVERRPAMAAEIGRDAILKCREDGAHVAAEQRVVLIHHARRHWRHRCTCRIHAEQRVASLEQREHVRERQRTEVDHGDDRAQLRCPKHGLHGLARADQQAVEPRVLQHRIAQVAQHRRRLRDLRVGEVLEVVEMQNQPTPIGALHDAHQVSQDTRAVDHDLPRRGGRHALADGGTADGGQGETAPAHPLAAGADEHLSRLHRLVVGQRRPVGQHGVVHHREYTTEERRGGGVGPTNSDIGCTGSPADSGSCQNGEERRLYTFHGVGKAESIGTLH